MSRPALLVSFLIALFILSINEFKTFMRVPKPQTFMHAVWVWAVLGIISEVGAPEIAAVFGFGLVIAMAYTYFKNKTPLLAPSSDVPGPTPTGVSGGSGLGNGGSSGGGAGGGGGGSF